MVSRSDRQDMAHVFADIYAELYADKSERSSLITNSGEISPFTREELVEQVWGLKNGRAADSAGVVAEFVK